LIPVFQKGQKFSGMAFFKFSEIVVKSIPLAWKIMATVFPGAEWGILLVFFSELLN
jgi:hypothetical protein